MVIEAVDGRRGDREVIEDEVEEGRGSGKAFVLLPYEFRESEVLISFRFRVRNSGEE